MKLKVFTQPGCPNCPPAKELAKKLKKDKPANLEIELFNTATVDGMAEGAFYQVMATPTVLLTDDQGKIVHDWRGRSPKEKEVLAHLS